MIYYELVKIRINITSLGAVIIYIIIRLHGLPDVILNNKKTVFNNKFYSLLCYFLDIKQ